MNFGAPGNSFFFSEYYDISPLLLPIPSFLSKNGRENTKISLSFIRFLFYFDIIEQALKVYVPSFESYGKMWPHLFIRVLAAMILYQVTMFGYFGVKKFYYAPILIPLPIITLIYGFICHKKFYRAFHVTALEVVSRELKETPNMEQIFRSFIPPSLISEKLNDDDNFEDALSQVSRQGSFV